MASTFLGELYFRSLKRINVLSVLTKYLLQYKRLCIPHIGTFVIVQQSPEFNVVEKTIHPPSYLLQLSKNESLSEHQLNYLAQFAQADIGKTWEELHEFGKKLRSRIQQNSFIWNGIGIIKIDSGKVFIDKELITVAGLETLKAHKLLRENVQHNMLVGDQEMTSKQVIDSLHKPDQKKSAVELIGWIALLIAVVTIFILLYNSGFNPLASGLKMKTSSHALY